MSASAAEILQQLRAQQAETNRLMQPTWPGLFGQHGRRQLKETALMRSAEAEERLQGQLSREELAGDVAQGALAQARAMGVDPNQMSPGQAIGAGVNAMQQARGGIGAENIAATIAGRPEVNPLLRAQLEEAQAQELEAQVGRYGSGLTRSEYEGVRDSYLTAQQGIDRSQFVMDVVANTTPAQLASPGMADTRGRLQFAVFGTLPVMQSLMEEKASTLREGERKAIEDFLGSPQDFVNGLFSFDKATIAKWKEIQRALQREQGAMTADLDERTLGLLESSAAPDQRWYNFQAPQGVPRDPALPEANTPLQLPGVRERIDLFEEGI